jgi:MoaA/NifB/PqqE/SkfB family radical SAM enzyme
MSPLIEIQPAPRLSPEDPEASPHRIIEMPILLLNIYTRCNCRCVMCDIWQREDAQELSVATLERQRESLIALKVRQVVLTGGEPLLHRDLGSILDFFRSLGVHITLLTTGLLLAKCAELVAASVDDIIVSLDGPAPVHNAIRRIPRAFETMAHGIDAVRRLNPGLPIAARTTVQKQNHTALRATVDAARTLGLDSISFLPADVSSSAFHRDQPWDAERQADVSLKADEVYALSDEIDALNDEKAHEISTGFIRESREKLRRLAQRFRERLENTQPKAPKCNAPWVSTVLEVDGTLRPCFFHAPVASTAHTTLTHALNSPQALEFRAKLDIANNPTCQRCVCSLNYAPIPG